MIHPARYQLSPDRPKNILMKNILSLTAAFAFIVIVIGNITIVA
jgi:hypothetical protein